MNRQDLINQFYENMAATKRLMHSRMHAFVGDCPISRSQMELLFTLKHLQPTSPKQLGKEMQLSPGAISQLLDGLVEQGLVDRQDDPSDRRAQTISISKIGVEKLREISEKRNKILQGALKELTTEELAILLKVQEKLTSKYTQISKEKRN